MQDEVVIQIVNDQVPLMTEQSPSQESSDIILDMPSPSDDPTQVREKSSYYLDFVLQGFMTTSSFFVNPIKSTRVSCKRKCDQPQEYLNVKRRGESLVYPCILHVFQFLCLLYLHCVI